MKKILFAVIATIVSLTVFAEPSKYLLNQFRQAYPDAKEVVWSESANGFGVYFKETAEKSVRVFYDRDENTTLTISYYPADYLKPELKRKMQWQHKNKQLMSVTECVNANGTNYYVLMQDAKRIYRVQYLESGDEYMITERMDKQK